jgi:hypothetical protein
LSTHGWCADSAQNYIKQNALIKALLPNATMIQGFSHIPAGEALEQAVKQKIKSFYNAYNDILKLWNEADKSAKLVALFEEYNDFRDYGSRILIPEVSDYSVQKQIQIDLDAMKNLDSEETRAYFKRRISNYYKRKRQIYDRWSLDDKGMHVEMSNLYKDYEDFTDENNESIISDIRKREGCYY